MPVLDQPFQKPPEKANESPLCLLDVVEREIINPVLRKKSDEPAREVQLDDGQYKRNSDGRVVETSSPDGKLKRTFEYNDKRDPKQVTAVTIGDTTYKYLSPVTSEGKPFVREGLVMGSWSTYDQQGKLTGNWSGHIAMNDNGVYTLFDNKQGVLRREGADGKPLSEAEAKKRTEEGIWPNTVEASRPDGTAIVAERKGKTVETIKESLKEDGKDVIRTWKRDGSKYISDDKPPRERPQISVDENGVMTVVETDGTKVVTQKSADYAVTKDGATNFYNRYGTQVGAETIDGARKFKSADPSDPKSV
jgi:hypothetical protein